MTTMTTKLVLPKMQDVYRGNLPFVTDNTILATLHGSHAYGLATETSDIDIKGVCIPPMEYMLGFSKKFEQAEGKDPYDLAIYEIRKFFKLAAACNPNIIEVLFTEPEEMIYVSQEGQRLLDHREMFLSQKVRHTFAGYARSQLGRINTHYKWLKNPPVAEPQRSDFGLGDAGSLIPTEQLGAAQTEILKKMEEFDFDWTVMDEADRISLKQNISKFFAEMNLSSEEVWTRTARTIGFGDNFIEILKKERAYKAKKAEWDQYQHWLKERNPKRSALEAKFSYDTKHASHLVRLLRMCKEILTTGVVQVKRIHDREELLAIKNHGIWTYEELISWADKQEKEIAEIAKTCKVLPKEPDLDVLNALCQNIILQHKL